MRYLILLLFFLPSTLLAQETDTTKVAELKADIKLYKTFNLKNDTIVIDTTLTIQDEYKYNYLRKDNFGLLSFANEGYLFTQLDYSKKNNFILPQFGYTAKHSTYLENKDILYYSVPTPLTDIYFKTVMRQGQSLDALLSVNTKKNLNFTIAYKSIRSVGDYFNNLTSSGHFRFTSNYYSPNRKYYLQANFVGQDIFNQENGGILTLSQLDGTNTSFNQRERVDVFFNDAKSKLKGNRYFLNQSYQFKRTNSLVISHQISFENKFYEFIQNTVNNARLGPNLYTSVNNKTNFNWLYNKLALSYTTNNFGKVNFFLENLSSNQFYTKPDNTTFISTIPYNFRRDITNLGASYDFSKQNWIFNAQVQNSISILPSSNIEAFAQYNFSNNQFVKISAQQVSKIPDNTFVYHQSDYFNFNWTANFKNEKKSILKLETVNNWFQANVMFTNLLNHLYFQNTSSNNTLLNISPTQSTASIQYFSAEIAKEFKYKNWALDNRIKVQEVNQTSKILNLPNIIVRNSLYFTKPVFKKAMLLQTGILVNYFSSYFADEYNPIIGDFFTQNQTKIGNFPVLDFFVNARVQQCRIYLKAEHLNALFSNKVTYFNTPTQPFRDFHIRFGLEWNFFK